MVAASYSNNQFVEIICNALKRWHGDEAAATMLAEGVDLDRVFAALSNTTASTLDRGWALNVLRRALAPGGPFTTIPDLLAPFHIRLRRSGIIVDGIECVTNDAIRPGRNVVMLLRTTEQKGGRPTVPQELIDELDREACATLTKAGDPLKKEVRAELIQRALADKGYPLAIGTIENRLKAKRP